MFWIIKSKKKYYKHTENVYNKKGTILYKTERVLLQGLFMFRDCRVV